MLVMLMALLGCGTAGEISDPPTLDAGADAAIVDAQDAAPPCSPCRDAVLGELPIAAAKNLCAGLAAECYAAIITCGCGDGGACSAQCGSTAWCTGVYPKPTTWTPPAGACEVCMGNYAPGCGSESAACWAN